ncbi:MAG: phosphoribosylamine--glycine ligase [Solirubrobacteraceae bacterium]
MARSARIEAAPSGHDRVPRVLVVGAGAREHAILQALARSPQRPELLAAPGNPGIGQIARLLPIAAHDVAALAQAAGEQDVDLVVAGPEAPLVAGLADQLAAVGIPCFGPTAEGARLEGSKAFCKEVMTAAGVPTADYRVVSNVEEGIAAITAIQDGRYPAVIKADGLAAGKGVILAANQQEARQALHELLVEHRFGTDRVVVEQHLTGPEVSLLTVCDGVSAVPLACAQDYKRIFDGDRGPNTGGMGSYSPVPGIGPERAAALVADIHQPLLDELRRRSISFRGVLYAGVMLTADGPRVLEFNVRFGDPETQAILPRLRSDLLELFAAATRPVGGLADLAPLVWDPRTAVTVVLASAGYPEGFHAGDVISGLDRLPGPADELSVTDRQPADVWATDRGLADVWARDRGPADVWVTHAGTALDAQGRLVTAGGRVLSVTALGQDASQARAAAYAAAGTINFDGCQLRSDIAEKVVSE